MITHLETLAATIAAHARELAGKEWEREHRPVLLAIWRSAKPGVWFAKRWSTNDPPG